MYNDAIFIPGEDPKDCEEVLETIPQEYLKILESLKEIADNNTQACARRNLGVLSAEEVEAQIDTVNTKFNEITDELLTVTNDLSNTLETIQNNQSEFIKKDGSVKFTDVLLGITPTDKTLDALTTVEFVLNKLSNYTNTSELKSYLESLLEILDQYVLLSDVYKKSNTYCKSLIDNKLKLYLQLDGVGLTIKYPVNGAYPQTSTNLATKGYIDELLRLHKSAVDPHNFISKLNSKLSNYYLKSEVYTKAQSYSRILIDNIIDSLVKDSLKNIIELHINTTPHITSQEVRLIIKSYASTNLISKEELETLSDSLQDKIVNVKPIWKTSGPVLTTVGFVEDNTELPAEMTMLEVLDSIFYGSKVSLTIESTSIIGSPVDITICIHSGLPTNSINLYLNGELANSFSKELFEDGCMTIQSENLTEDTEFKLEVVFSNGSVHEETAYVKVLAPSYVGSIPLFMFTDNLRLSDILELISIDSTNNRLISLIEDSYTMQYSFSDPKYRKLFIAIPANSQKELDTISTQSQSFNSDSFSKVKMHLLIEGIKKGIIYDVYVYNLPLIKLNSEVTFNFKPDEQ